MSKQAKFPVVLLLILIGLVALLVSILMSAGQEIRKRNVLVQECITEGGVPGNHPESVRRVRRARPGNDPMT